jgi:phenylacetate-CoA ligase
MRRGPIAAPLTHRLAGSLHVAREVVATRGLADAALAAVRRAQERRLARTIAHAAATVPYYRDTLRALGLAPGDVRTAADLARLPIVERRHVQEDPERFLSSARPRSEYLELRTGGSSGAPLSVHHDPLSVLENTAHGERHRATLRRLTGRRRFRTLLVGSPRGADAELRAFASRFALLPRSAAGAMVHFTMADRPEDVARAIARSRPDVVLGYGSYLERIAQILEEEYPRGSAPLVFAYGGDAMAPSARARIATRLGATVWSSYQAVECLKIAFECVRGAGLHVHADLCALRVVNRDGDEVAPGGTGEVVISNLVNRATVLLNYRLGDEVTLLDQACGCGSPPPLLSFPEGRVEDWFPLPSGERVYTQRLRALFTDEREVWRYQIVQERPSALRIALVAADGADRAVIASRIGAAVARVVGPGVAITVDYVNDLERTADGKVRVVVRRGAAG